MKTKTLLSSLFILLTIAVLAFFAFRQHNSSPVDEPNGSSAKRDTVVVFKTDTIVEYIVKYQEKKTTDTVWVEKEGLNIALPVVQKFYQNKGIYDLWISGIEPVGIDSIKWYKQTEYVNITNVVENNSYKVYVGGGLFSFRETLTPYAGISLSAPKKWLISANFCLNGYFGVSVKYKLFEYGKRY